MFINNWIYSKVEATENMFKQYRNLILFLKNKTQKWEANVEHLFKRGFMFPQRKLFCKQPQNFVLKL